MSQSPSQSPSVTTPPRWIRWILPTTAEACFFALTLVMLFGRPSERFFLDGDPGWHIRAGQYMLETRSIPHHDIFSFSMPNAWWVTYEWGTEIIFAVLDHRFGLNGVVLFVVFVLAGSYTLLYKFLRQEGFSFTLTFSLLLFTVMGSSFHWLARPHVVSYLFVILFFHLLDRYKQGKVTSGQLWLLPLLMLVWVNLHAGFIAGTLLVLTYFSSAVLRFIFSTPSQQAPVKTTISDLGKISLATLMASLINPNGYGLYLYLFEYFKTVHLLNPINELHSPSFQFTFFQPFLAAIVGLIFLLRYSRYELRLDDCLNLAVWLALGLISSRNIAVMFFVCTPIYGHLLQGLKEPLRNWISRLPSVQEKLQRLFQRIENVISMEVHFNRHLMSSLFVLILIVVVIHHGYLLGQPMMDFRFPAWHFPAGAVQYLQSHMPAGNGFNEWELGGYLIYNFYPKLKVFVDGRLDMYGDVFARQYVNLIHTPEGGEGMENWKVVFERYRIQWAILRPDVALRYALDADPSWSRRYLDSKSVIFFRTSDQSKK